MTTCGGCEPLQHKWIKIWSQWSFEWLSLRKNMTENKASAQTPHYIEQNHKKKKTPFQSQLSFIIMPLKSMSFLVFSFTHRSPTRSSPLSILKVIKHRDECAALVCLLTMKVTLSPVADIQTHTDHPVCRPDSGCQGFRIRRRRSGVGLEAKWATNGNA